MSYFCYTLSLVTVFVQRWNVETLENVNRHACDDGLRGKQPVQLKQDNSRQNDCDHLYVVHTAEAFRVKWASSAWRVIISQ